MAADHLTVFQLPITGRRNRKRVVLEYAQVLDDAFTRGVLLARRWNLHPNGYIIGTAKDATGKWWRPLLHRMVYEHYHGPIPIDREIDHIDRNKRNNVPANLRLVTRSINNANIGPRKENTSGYHGVSWHGYGKGYWVAQLKVNGKRVLHSYHTDPREAAKAVNDAYQKYFPDVQPPNPHVD